VVDFIHEALSNQYGLRIRTVAEVQGGWSASAFVVDTDTGKYFVKLYDKNRPSVQPWIQRMAHYMPIVLWLSDSTPLKNRMVAPIYTKDNGYKAESARWILSVYPFVEGETLCETKLSSDQIHQLAETLALLHSYKENIPVPTGLITETYSLPFLERLSEILRTKGIPHNLKTVMSQHAGVMQKAINDLTILAEKLRRNPPANALCHTDVHGWNLMWGEKLILIDWEGLRLAPIEADLFAFSDRFFFDYAKEAFFSAYKRVCPAYMVNETAMRYYRLRRRLEDISEFAHSIANDGPVQSEMEKSIMHLQNEYAELERMY